MSAKNRQKPESCDIIRKTETEERAMKVKPLGDRVLVEILEAEEVTKGGIVLPDTAQEKPQQAKVVAVGKGKISDDGKVVPLEVKSGDVVLFGKYSGTELKIDDKNLLMLKEEDILGIIG
jgi:chaperonin GroES